MLELERQANSGNIAAQLALGDYYIKTQNYRKALDWYKKAANKEPEAAFKLGNIFQNGSGEIKKDINQARTWYEAASKHGHIQAQINLALTYIVINPKKAKEHMKKPAEAGNVQAQKLLAELHYYQKEEAESRKWYLKAANQNDTHSQCILAFFYIQEKNITQALFWYEKAAARNDKTALFNLGAIYSNGVLVSKDYKKAKVYYEKAANLNHAGAQYRLGNIYADVDNDFQKAFEWHKKAADNGDVDAKFLVAGLYYSGIDVEKDYENAKKLFLELAKKNHSNALYMLAVMHEDDEKDMQKALEYYHKAAEGLNPLALYKLMMHHKENGEVVESYKYYAILGLFKDKLNQSLKEKLDKYIKDAEITADDIKAAEELAKLFISTFTKK